MTPTASLLGNAPYDPSTGYHPRPVKKLKFAADELVCQDVLENNLLRRHPLGVRPSGNALTSAVNLKPACGLLALLPDDLLVVVTELLEATDLLRLGGTCRALHAYTRNEELWRGLFVQSHPREFSWRGSWRSTYLSQPMSTESVVDCSNLYSDALHRPFFCANADLLGLVSEIPKQNRIARMADLSYAEFEADWVNKPFILTEPVVQWPIYKTWSTADLLEKHANTLYRAEAVDWPLRRYVEYMDHNHDESPLYLFDCQFVEKMSLTVSQRPDPDADYWSPACFGSDLFSVLGSHRPDHRWLIVGPARSGSTFHKDPNATSAWNAVLRGTKYWIMFPSSSKLPPPPGVYVSDDQSEVTSPLSIAEWILGFHAQARRTPGCIEGVCGQGEVLHVPSGWYHLVLNLEPSIAITQNFVPRARLGAVLHFLRDQKQSISGFSSDVEDPYGLFKECLGAHDPMLLEEGLMALDKLGCGPRSSWNEIVQAEPDASEDSGGFTFGFAEEDDLVDVP